MQGFGNTIKQHSRAIGMAIAGMATAVKKRDEAEEKLSQILLRGRM